MKKDIERKIKSISEKVEPLTFVLYGKPGTGKTTILGTCPKVLHLDVREEGAGVLRKVKNLKSARIESWEELQDMYWFLKKGNHNFETVGLDTVGNCQLLAIEEVMRKNKKKGKPGDWGTMSQRMWGDVSSMCKDLFLSYRDLKKEGMNVGFLAHDRIFKATEENEDDDVISRIAPTVGPALSPSIVSVLNASVGLVGETFIGEKFKILKDEKTGKKREVKETNYYLRIGPHSSYMTKVRRPKGDKLPDALKDPTYEKLMELMK